jgi:transcriptional regulator with XRE-family HTH domain
MLMAETKLSGAEVARLAGISSKSVNNMLHGRHGPNLDHVEAVAAVFQLTGWQLILPGLRSDIARNGHLDALMQHYTDSSAEGRANIDRVAELEARYNVGK